ncbi:hypothetical protein [Streptomyces sp. NPDC059009]|uniref:hypothetical protein n=1 Tax=Streptomyces sp. NPDC059009 TaxID=3346694 RepID=UPI0036971412
MSTNSPIDDGKVVTVTFDYSVALPPMTCRAGTAVHEVERYLQRVMPGRLVVSLDDETARGTVRQDGGLVASFEVLPLGGEP